MKFTFTILLLIILNSTSYLVHGQGSSWIFSGFNRQTIESRSLNPDACAIDNFGNSVIGVTYNNVAYFDGLPIISTGCSGTDAAIIKLDSLKTIVWAFEINGYSGTGSHNTEAVYDVAVDSAGDVYACGKFGYNVTFNSKFPSYYDSTGIFVIKISSEGELVWIYTLKGQEGKTKIAVSNAGTVFVTGLFGNTINFGNGITIPYLNSGDRGYILKLSNSGIPQVVTPVDGRLFLLNELCFKDDRLYFTGVFKDSIRCQQFSATLIGNNYMPFLIVTDYNLQLLWGKFLTLNSSNFGGIAIDNNKNVYIGGSNSQGGLIEFDTSSFSSYNGSFYAKFNSSGMCQWIKGAVAGNGAIKEVLFNSDYGPLLIGTFLFSGGNGAHFKVVGMPNSGLSNIFNSADIFVIQIDSNGNFIGAERSYNNQANFIGLHVNVIEGCIDAKNIYYIIGTSAKDFIYGASTFSYLNDRVNGMYLLKVPPSYLFYYDQDNDGYGTELATTYSAVSPSSFVLYNGDCNDSNNTVFPGAKELCDSLDNDCNTIVDDSCEFSLRLKFFIEGFYIGNNLMRPVMSPVLYPTIVDTVVISLNDPQFPFASSYLTSSLLHTDGSLEVSIPATHAGNSYFVVISHRNALETWSKYPISFNNPTIYLDFTHL